MKAETWEELNGTGWGQLLSEDANPSDNGETVATSPCRGGLEIPMFMFETTQSVLVPASAYRAQGVGRARKKERAEKKQRRDFINGIAYVALAFGLLVLANLAVEVICR